VRIGRPGWAAELLCKCEDWLPFLNTYRTMCIAPEPAFKRVLENIRQFQLAA
jgi:hypothetical protein